ncbi:MAG: hypothetical protein ACYCQI_11390 [Gammaproteobacteria bacterium]
MLKDRKEVTAQLNPYLSPDVTKLVTSYISDTLPWMTEEMKKPRKKCGWW